VVPAALGIGVPDEGEQASGDRVGMDRTDRSVLPIIFITASSPPTTMRRRQRVQEAGAAGYLPKPFAAGPA
jgi:CheY-like chemotaxis protein